MTDRRLHVISYDIAKDSARTRMAKILLDYGDRVQCSVFEAQLDAKDVERILRRARRLVAEGDSLRIYALCAACSEKVQSLGREGPLGVEDIVVI